MQDTNSYWLTGRSNRLFCFECQPIGALALAVLSPDTALSSCRAVRLDQRRLARLLSLEHRPQTNWYTSKALRMRPLNSESFSRALQPEQTSHVSSAGARFRLICARARVDYLHFTGGWLNRATRSRFKAAERELVDAPLWIAAPHLSGPQIVNAIEMWSAKYTGGLAILDGLDGPESSVAAESCTRALKSVAVRTKTAILATRM